LILYAEKDLGDLGKQAVQMSKALQEAKCESDCRMMQERDHGSILRNIAPMLSMTGVGAEIIAPMAVPVSSVGKTPYPRWVGSRRGSVPFGLASTSAARAGSSSDRAVPRR
jgi:hypothetical protein